MNNPEGNTAPSRVGVPRSRGKGGFLIKVLLVLLCIAYLVYSLRQLGWQDLGKAFSEADRLWLLLSFIPLALRFWVWGFKWKLMVDRAVKIPTSVMHRLILAGAFLNLVTPSAKLAGGFFRAVALRAYSGVRRSESFGWVVADQISHMYGNFFLFGIVALFSFTAVGAAFPFQYLVLSVVLGLGIPIGWTSLRPYLWKKWRDRPPPSAERLWVPKALRAYRKPEDNTWLRLFMRPILSKGGPAAYLSVECGAAGLSYFMLILANAFVIKALGVEAGLLPVTAVLMAAYLLGSVLGFMGGIGVTELFLIKLYPLAGVDPTSAAAAALLHRVTYYMYMLIIGGGAFGIMSKQVGELSNVQTGEDETA